jgi:hypothetical protein
MPEPTAEPTVAAMAKSPDEAANEKQSAAAEEPKLSEPDLFPSLPPPACESFGTQLQFVSNPIDAARLARQENKLMFVLHISGNFEDDKFT